EIGEAIVELRLAELSAQRQRWDEAGSPKDQLCACIQGVLENKDFLAERGCAVGTFCSELHTCPGSRASFGHSGRGKTPTALPCICFPPCKAFRSWLIPFVTPVLWRQRPSASRVGFKACETPGGLNPQAHTAKPESRHVAAGTLVYLAIS